MSFNENILCVKHRRGPQGNSGEHDKVCVFKKESLLVDLPVSTFLIWSHQWLPIPLGIKSELLIMVLKPWSGLCLTLWPCLTLLSLWFTKLQMHCLFLWSWHGLSSSLPQGVFACHFLYVPITPSPSHPLAGSFVSFVPKLQRDVFPPSALFYLFFKAFIILWK